MATTPIVLEKGVWTLITTTSCSFQALDNDMISTESATLPTSSSHPAKFNFARRIYEFERVDGNLYGLSRDGTRVSFDPVI